MMEKVKTKEKLIAVKEGLTAKVHVFKFPSGTQIHGAVVLCGVNEGKPIALTLTLDQLDLINEAVRSAAEAIQEDGR